MHDACARPQLTGKKRKRKRAKKAPGTRSAIGYAFTEAVSSIVGDSAPASVVSLATAMFSAARTGGKEIHDAAGNALLGLYNQGWRRDANGAWSKSAPAAVVFADQINRNGKIVGFRMRDVDVTTPGSWTGSINGAPATLVFRSDIDEHQEPNVVSLPQLARDTNEVLDELKPPMTLDHPGRRRGPAYGWNGAWYVDGEGHLRTKAIEYIPEPIANMIEERRYKRLSPGIRPNYTAKNGKTYRWVVDHTAILGAATPAMKDLEDLPEELEALYAASEIGGDVWLEAQEAGAVEETMSGQSKEGTAQAGAGGASPPGGDQGGKPVTLSKEQEAIVAQMIAAALEGANQTIASLKAENDEHKAWREQKQQADVERDAKDLVASFAEPDGHGRVRILPAVRGHYERLARVLALLPKDTIYRFSEGGQERAVAPLTLLKEALEATPPVLFLGDKAPASGGGSKESLEEAVATFSDDDLARIGTTRERVTEAFKALREQKGNVRLTLDPSVAAVGVKP